MKTNIKKISLVCTLFLLLLSCEKSSKPNSPLEKPLLETLPDKTPTDKEIKKLYAQYGTLIEYKYDRNAFAPGAKADPVKEEDVIPFMKALKILYFDALKEVTGSDDFIKKESPIKIYLIGNGIGYGGQFGEGTAGQAGDIRPNRLTLGGVNSFGRLLRDNSPGSDQKFLSHMLEQSEFSNPGEGGINAFIYHEYTHFMDAKHDIPNRFEEPAIDKYLKGTNAYVSIPPFIARLRGFMLPYGMQNEAEDFATYVQIMVWKSRDSIEKNYLTSDASKVKIKLVYDYYKSFGLDLYKLQEVLNSDKTKKRLLELKDEYDGTK